MSLAYRPCRKVRQFGENAMTYRICIDTGGTFSDVVIAESSGIVAMEKSLTTPDRIFDGIESALSIAAQSLKLDLGSLLANTDLLIYGTTRSTNAIVQGKVAKTALLVTKGFPDILVFREGGRTNPYDFSSEFPAPYIPRRYTFEIEERVSSEGDIVSPLSEPDATDILSYLRLRQFEAIAVCFIWSVANPIHELRMGALIEEYLPNVPYTLSHKLIPILREYRRASATAIDASLKPLMQHHLMEMEHDLRTAGYAGEILVSTSMGGCMHVGDLIDRPVHTLKSGPAMAPVAGRAYAARESLGGDVIVCDAGGTTFDVGLVRDRELVYTRETWLGVRWTGHILSTSTVDVRSVGSGGGSIAWIDSGGLLRVGPQSAGAIPGPACYGAGGEEPTVTDAAVLLGYLDPEYFLGGRMRLDRNAAFRVVSKLAGQLSLPIERASYAILNLTNEHMIKAIQEITVSEGFDPRESVIVAGGGAAGMGILPIAQELGCEKVIIPKMAGALSACGMQFSDIVFEHNVSCHTLTNSFDFSQVNEALDSLDSELALFSRRLHDRGFPDARISHLVEARYLYQMWEIEVLLPHARFNNSNDLRDFIDAFHNAHERIFSVMDRANPIECLIWKGRVTIPIGKPVQEAFRANSIVATREYRRRAFFGDSGWIDTPILRGDQLRPGEVFWGPAIIEEPTTTLVVYPQMSVRLSDTGNYLATVHVIQ